MDNISARFLQGLARHNLSLAEIESGSWKYCGGSKGRHAKYFQLVYPDRGFPEH
jgi:hypothetical protein